MSAPTYFSIGKYEFKEENGEIWLKIFYHNCTNKVFFVPGTNEVLDSNTAQKYSILGLINDKMKIDDKYEFVLEYPETSKINHWRQSNNPVFDFENSDIGIYNVSGYEPINIMMINNNWGGLVRSSSSHTFVEGTVGEGGWFYAIGQYSSTWNNGKIAGEIAVMEVILWIKITDSSLIFAQSICTPVYLFNVNNNLLVAFYLLSFS